MRNRIPILLDEKTAEGLVALAKQEFRDPSQQAAVIIRNELIRRGFLATETQVDTVNLHSSPVIDPQPDNCSPLADPK